VSVGARATSAGAGSRPVPVTPVPGAGPVTAAETGVLIVDDCPEDRYGYGRLLSGGGRWTVLEAASGATGLELALSGRAGVVLLDYDLPDLDGLEMLRDLRARGATTLPVVMVTGHGSEDVAVAALKAGAQDYLIKDAITASTLDRTLRGAIDRAALEREVEEKRRALERSNEELRRLHHVVSHELRGPLTIAREFVSLLLEDGADPLTAAQLEHLEYVRDACGQMATYVGDLLDLARVETGKLTLRLQVGTLDGVLRHALRPFVRAAALRNVRVRVDVPGALPAVVLDAPRIVQVLANLLGNALKFTLPFGEIAVRARHDRAQGCIVVSVADTGEGIAAESLPRVFERAYQAAGDGHREGLGLGLAIAREIVLLHGGCIQAESVPGRGSTFSFTLPVATSSAGVPGDSDPAREAQP